MDSTVVQYILFILAALALIWVVALLNRRLLHHDRPGTTSLKTWVKFDPRRPAAREDPPPVFEEEEEEVAELHARARQNGHHAQGQRPKL